MYRVRDARRRDCVARCRQCRLDDSVDSETRYASRRGISDGPEVIESAVRSRRIVHRFFIMYHPPHRAPKDLLRISIQRIKRNMIFMREVRSTKLNSLVGDLLSDAHVLRSGAPSTGTLVNVHERTLTCRRIKRLEGHPARGRPKAVTRPATAGYTSRSVTDRQPHRHTHSCEARVEAPRRAAPSRALEAVRRGGPCPV